jgi:replication initiator protein RepSA
MTVELPGVPPQANVNDVVTQMIRRAASASFENWWKKVEEVGFCANPIHLTGGDELGREHQVLTRCNNRRAIVCPSCSDLYARDTWQLIDAGLRGGHHEIPTTVAEHPQVFVTLTAPSFGAVHTTRTTGSCHPPGTRWGRCPHGNPRWCEAAHDHNEPALGQPLCRDCYDYLGHVLFSWHAPELWRRFTIQLRRLLSRRLRDQAENPKNTRVSFMKVLSSNGVDSPTSMRSYGWMPRHSRAKHSRRRIRT